MRHLTQGSRRELDYRAYLTRSDLVPKAVRFMLETGPSGQISDSTNHIPSHKTDLKQPAAYHSQGCALAEVGTETR